MDDMIRETLKFIEENHSPEEWIVVEDIPTPLPQKTDTLASTLGELAPTLLAKAPPPDDRSAKLIATGWKSRALIADVTLLSLHPNSPTHQFLINLQKAIDTHLAPAKILLAPQMEQEKRWEFIFSTPGIKHLLSFPIPFAHFPLLRSHYRENPATKETFFNSTPLIFLRPLGDYQNDPSLKKELWSHLCHVLSSQPSS